MNRAAVSLCLIILLAVPAHPWKNGGETKDPSKLTTAKKYLKPDEWGQDFKDQTGENISYAANAIAKLLKRIGEQ